MLAALGARYDTEQQPQAITAISIVGIGDRLSLGADHLAKEGLTRRSITSTLIDSPALMKMAVDDKIESWTFPQGALSQLRREMAGGHPGLMTKTGLHTFVDPRQQGGRQSPSTPAQFVEVKKIDGEEWLFFRPLPLNVALLRGTTADEDGNITMEEEAVLGEMLAMAQATRRAAGGGRRKRICWIPLF
ncbi:Acetate CoA-transferase YdiF [Sodalis glossinidius str. 'morsitans']|uniref:Acetate CoA-transferase YdiF n=1 Tax=Sodalis glossinidius (strain morsitans) TaxID=343509 RepID=A0A193QME8_SODGM|nr:CoA-transferase [Sodalis glossinidius]CRL46336.1 Acetate CoA-transferase YdiF [Sodalis glossinidius str. 'morsitans']